MLFTKTGQVHGTVTTAQDYHLQLSELIDALQQSPHISGYCYTQLTDTMQETNGLLDAERQPKLEIAQVRALLERPSKAIPKEKLDLARKVVRLKTNGKSDRHILKSSLGLVRVDKGKLVLSGPAARLA